MIFPDVPYSGITMSPTDFAEFGRRLAVRTENSFSVSFFGGIRVHQSAGMPEGFVCFNLYDGSIRVANLRTKESAWLPKPANLDIGIEWLMSREAEKEAICSKGKTEKTR